MTKLGKAGLIARFKPLHNGAALMLEQVCMQADHVIIGIGSCNKYNARNPFTADESRAMVDLYLRQRFSNYEFINVPDYGQIQAYKNGRRWRAEVILAFGGLDSFVTANPYVAQLLSDHYRIVHPSELIPHDKWIPIRASMVRYAMATGQDYRRLVPDVVSAYLEKNKMVERFRREFGLETIAGIQERNYTGREDADAEKKNAQEL